MSRNELIEKNIGLARMVAYKFIGFGEYEDLFGTCCVGLVKAADSFDESKGTKFSTYAVLIIKSEIFHFMRDHKKKEIKSESLDKVIYDNGNDNVLTVKDFIEDKTVSFTDLENKEFIHKMYMVLTDEERLCIQLSFFDEVKQTDIAKFIGKSQPQVYRIINRALQKMRQECLKMGVI